jgi:hypothetical protein
MNNNCTTVTLLNLLHALCTCFQLADSSWIVMAHGDAREGKWRGNWRMEWIASTLYTTSEHDVSSITTITPADAHTSAAICRLNCPHPPPPPADLNGFVRFAERQNLVSARVQSHFKCRLKKHLLENTSTAVFTCLPLTSLGGILG